MKTSDNFDIPVGTQAFILSKLYYGVLTKNLEQLEIERYYSILHFIHGNDGCTQKHICSALAIDKTAMVKIIDYLMQIGFIERSKNPNDRREHFITLTKKGGKQTQEIVDAFNALDEKIFSGTSPEEKKTFTSVLQRMSNQLREMPGNLLLFNYIKPDQPKKQPENQAQNENT